MNAPLTLTAATGISARCADALAGRPFVLSSLYSDADWTAALEYAADGDLSELEWMIARDAAFERFGNREDWDFEDWVDRFAPEGSITAAIRDARRFIPAHERRAA
jgi:hypothetical protein